MSSTKINLPPNIENYVQQIDSLEQKERLSGEEKRKLATCKLKVAVWACMAEGVQLSRFALSEILGPDTAFVFQHGQNAMMSLPWETQEDIKAIRHIYEKRTGKKIKSKGGKGGSFNPFD